MFKIIRLNDKNDYFYKVSERVSESVYMCRITGFGSGVKPFLAKYVGECRKNGIYIKNGIKNPDMQQLEYYKARLGNEFFLNIQFLRQSIGKWLPSLASLRLEYLSEAVFLSLESLKKSGANESIIKNTYIKYMCGFYYKFSSLLTKSFDDNIPKIVYEGKILKSTLELLKIICSCGYDLLLADFGGEDDYIKTDPENKYTQLIDIKYPMAVPSGFVLYNACENENNINHTEPPKTNIHEVNKKADFYPFPKAAGEVCTNTWTNENPLQSSSAGHNERGNEKNIYKNVFAYIKGTWDGYLKDILDFRTSIENSGRNLIIVENKISPPENSEISGIGKRDYIDETEFINEMCRKISVPECIELERLLKRSFYDIIKEGSMSVPRRKSRAATILCWIKRYIPLLFKNPAMIQHPVFIYWGCVQSENESDFLRILSSVSADVLIFDPESRDYSPLADRTLLKKEYPDVMPMMKFPENARDISFTTAAYDAGKELDSILYENTGLYRTGQFVRAESIILKTTFDEISILWNEDAKYRPNFKAGNGVVTVPVLFSKVSGVLDNRNEYFSIIASLSENSFVINEFPYIDAAAENKVKPYAAGFYKNGKLLKDRIRNSPCYQYEFLNSQTQDYILEKLELLISSELIAGTHKNGAEYVIISTALNLDKQIIRMIQSFDFTKAIPKILITNTSENMPTLEDASMLAFLSYIGFDIVIFSPTGYQSVEKYFTKNTLENHIIGSYIYDIDITKNIRKIKNIKKPSGAILSRLFGNSFRKER